MRISQNIVARETGPSVRQESAGGLLQLVTVHRQRLIIVKMKNRLNYKLDLFFTGIVSQVSILDD